MSVDTYFTDKIMLNLIDVCAIKFNSMRELKNNNLKITNEEFIVE